MKQKIEIIAEDESLILVNKPSLVLTLPDRHDKSKLNLQTFLQSKYPEVFVVHRLDKETSGIICFAKTKEAHANLCQQFENREVDKLYLALVDGVVPEDGVIDQPIASHPIIPGKMTTHKKGKASLTYYKIREQFKNYTLLDTIIKTGRTHQIRVHMKSIGFPMLVDKLYGRRSAFFLSEVKQRSYKKGKFTEEERPLISRTTLHAYQLSFTHPVSGEKVSFEADLHKDFRAVLQQLRKWGM